MQGRGVPVAMTRGLAAAGSAHADRTAQDRTEIRELAQQGPVTLREALQRSFQRGQGRFFA